MDLYYAKAYQRERLQDARNRRIVAEISHTDEGHQKSPWRLAIGILSGGNSSISGRSVAAGSLEPACCF